MSASRYKVNVSSTNMSKEFHTNETIKWFCLKSKKDWHVSVGNKSSGDGIDGWVDVELDGGGQGVLPHPDVLSLSKDFPHGVDSLGAKLCLEVFIIANLDSQT